MASVLTEAFLDLFYPHTCPMCGQYIEDNAPAVPQRERILCGDCLHALPRTEQALIQDNDTEMTLWGSAKSRAAAKKVMHLDHAAAFLFFSAVDNSRRRRVDIEFSSVEGKNKIGRADPFIIPSIESADSPEQPNFISFFGTRTFSKVLKNEFK